MRRSEPAAGTIRLSERAGRGVLFAAPAAAHQPAAGQILFDGTDLARLGGEALRTPRRSRTVIDVLEQTASTAPPVP